LKLPDPANKGDYLPAFDVSPGEFRRRAAAAGWRLKTIELFLAGKPIKDHVAVGEQDDRAMLRVVE